METLDSCFKGFPPCELDAAIGGGHCLLLLDIYPCVTACMCMCARLYDGWTASHKFPYSGPSTCRPAQRWKIWGLGGLRGRTAKPPVAQPDSDWRRGWWDSGGTPKTSGCSGVRGGPLIYSLLLCMWQHYICNTRTHKNNKHKTKTTTTAQVQTLQAAATL